MSSDAHFTFLRRLGPPDHSLDASNPNGQSTSNSNSYSNSTNAGLRFYLDSRDADPTNNNDRDPFPPTIVDRDRIANQVNQLDTEPFDEQDEREDITVRLQHREAISVPWHLLPPYQSDDLDILPSEAHPSYPYGVPFLPTSLPPYSSKPKLPPFSSNSLQYLSSMNLHLPPNQRGGNNPTNRPHVGTTNSTSSNTYHGNGNKIRESLSKNLDSEDLPIDLKMKSKVSTILKPSIYPFKKIGPGKSIRRNPKDYFNKHSVNGGGDSFNLSGTQMEIWSDLGLNEILPKGKEKDPLLDTSNMELSEEVYLLSGSGGVGGISDWKGSHQFPDETYGKGKDKGLGHSMEEEFNRLNLPFFSEHLPSNAYPNRYSGESSTRPSVPESYAYGRLNQTSTHNHDNNNDDLHPSIVIAEEQRREEHLRNERLGQEYPNIHRNSNFISNPNPLAHQMEIRIGLDRAERIWATNTRKERVEKHLNEIYAMGKGKGKGKIDETKYRREFWDLFLNSKGGKEGQIGYSVLEKDEEDGRRSSKVIKDGVSFSSSVDDEKRKEGGRIRWGEGIV